MLGVHFDFKGVLWAMGLQGVTPNTNTTNLDPLSQVVADFLKACHNRLSWQGNSQQRLLACALGSRSGFMAKGKA